MLKEIGDFTRPNLLFVALCRDDLNLGAIELNAPLLDLRCNGID